MSTVCERDVGEIILSDVDVADAMAHISGYLDITSEDFRLLSHLAHHHAIDRLVGGISAESLMRTGLPFLSADMMMDQAAQTIVASGLKGLPVADQHGKIIGMLTETDFLRRLKVNSFLELMLRLISDNGELEHRCHETRVAEAMTAPVVCVEAIAGFREVLEAFRLHGGRSMPVVDQNGALLGLLLRKDFLLALKLDVPL